MNPTVLWPLFATATSGIFGVLLGLWVTGRREQRRWLQETKLREYAKIMLVTIEWEKAESENALNGVDWPTSMATTAAPSFLFIRNRRLRSLINDFIEITQRFDSQYENLDRKSYRQLATDLHSCAGSVRETLEEDLLSGR